jgi:hypothetical protein
MYELLCVAKTYELRKRRPETGKLRPETGDLKPET